MDDIELIKEKIGIVDLISEYLTLKKAGANFKANCPFHQERTPSFIVSPERQIWHCFGCDLGGDIFKFLMEKERLTFPEALETLAQKAGVVLKRSKREVISINERIYQINQKAQQFFHYLLTSHKIGKRALEYLGNRGLTESTIKLFNLGYAPNSWETLTKFLKKRGFSTKELIASGICVPSRSGCYDRFRGRIIFPLIDLKGKTIGFSGRILSQGEPTTPAGGPKYINTPQTPVFDKKRLLFGLQLSKGDIRTKKEAILVEGEMDMILSFQSGVKNIVASKGTALSEEQIEILKKQADTISLCFDTDLAGDAAARRGIEMADKMGLNIKVIQIEGGKDPAEICVVDPESWVKMVDNSKPIYDYYLQSSSNRYDLKLASSKRAIFRELLPIWSKISEPITREHYIQKLAALLQTKDELIRQQIVKFQSEQAKIVIKSPISQIKQSEEIKQKTDDKPFDRRKLLEEYLISLIMHIPSDHIYVPNFPETLLTQEELRQVYVLLVLFLDSVSFKGASFKISEFIKTIPEEMVILVDRLYLMPIDEKLADKNLWQKEVDSATSQLKKMLIKTSLEKLSLQIKSAQEFDKIEVLETLNKRFRDLSVKLKNL
ncbi:DNA primase [Candidatus Daviesbacteria bacterium]|nr:DNA primase [Candidatus Daviesbacteria bacterium]